SRVYFGFAIKNCTLLSWVSNFWGAVQLSGLFVFINHRSPKSFRLQEGGKRTNPDELTKVSDSGERMQPAHLRPEG
ncbi:hypothetical protein, partial [Rahnella variigena]|uniref:hypothetical protein n=1 Tax=Rahnella variigena TaxID=574964 RepID=UPI001B866DA7